MRISLPRLPFREDKVFSLVVLLSLVVPLAFNFYLYEKFETVKLSLWLIILGGLFFVALKYKPLIKKNNYILLLSTGLLIFGFISSLFSIGLVNSFFGFYPRYTSGFLFYVIWVLTLWTFVFFINNPKWHVLLKVFFFDSLVIALVGLLQSFGIGYYEGLDQSFIARAPSLLGNPNFSTMFLVSALFFVVPLVKQASSFKAKIYYYLSAFIMLWAIANLSSRGAILGLLVGLVFFIPLNLLGKFSKKTILLSFLSVVFAVGLIFTTIQISRPGSLKAALKVSEINIDTRFFAWDVATQAILKHPYLGLGPGNLQVFFERFRPSNMATQGGVFDDAHNLFLQMSATTGLPFCLSFLALIGYAFWNGYRALKADNNNFLAAALVAALITWLVTSCFSPVSIGNYYLLIFILSGLFLHTEGASFEFKPHKIFKSLGGAVGIIFIVFGLDLLVSESFFYQGYINYQHYQFHESQQMLKTAIALNPTNQLYFLYAAADNIILQPNADSLQKSIEKILALQPAMARSQVMAANLSYLMYDRIKDRNYLKQAVTHMLNSLNMDKYFGPRYGHTAFYLAEDGQLSLAREYAKAGVAFNPYNLPSWLLLARIYQLENRLPQVQFALSGAFKLNPDDPYLKKLNEQAKSAKSASQLEIPAFVNIFQIEP